MKVNTISLNSVRLNTIALNHIGEIRSGGGGSKPSPIPQWIREHVVFYYDVKKQGATNETLKESAYLQDLSGKGRRMKLTSFLFDKMSGVDGYKNEAFNKSLGSYFKWELIDSRTIKGKASQVFIDFGYYNVKDVTNNVMHINWHIDGIQEGNKVYLTQYTYNNFKIELHNGDNHVALDVSENTDRPNYFYVSVISDQPYSTDITITQIPEYPGALVTDGVDDYGLVENLSSGVKMLFMTVNPMSKNRVLYDARNNSGFAIYNDNTMIAYQAVNKQGFTYINGVLNKTIYPYDLVGEKQVITICNDTVPDSVKGMDVLFASFNKNENMSCAFYNSIAFDSIPTEADGFTEQELIDYVITNIIGQ